MSLLIIKRFSSKILKKKLRVEFLWAAAILLSSAFYTIWDGKFTWNKIVFCVCFFCEKSIMDMQTYNSVPAVTNKYRNREGSSRQQYAGYTYNPYRRGKFQSRRRPLFKNRCWRNSHIVVDAASITQQQQPQPVVPSLIKPQSTPPTPLQPHEESKVPRYNKDTTRIDLEPSIPVPCTTPEDSVLLLEKPESEHVLGLDDVILMDS